MRETPAAQRWERKTMADFVIAKFQVFFEKNVLNLTCVRNQGHLHAAKYCVADVQDDLPCGTATGANYFYAAGRV
jgi:hypothetical protein